ncbi:hypothetical protein HD553DRAFT_340421 [Filobasidium floriforme]|uniref:uncharacterized protein n=1 Tax=Filobasidium floriforme TaxID=5210 RepID=UPI001E8CA49E|nr:uncharacterized protein HD553DRAFT_340421 [Filobasidium floriforme]KAH8087258.1 hypothetical protein HD553DRAFT_340421 [Filobasidium floriforme]
MTSIEQPRASTEQPRAPYAPITPIDQVDQSASNNAGLRPSQSAVAIERQHTGYPHLSQMITTFPPPNPPSGSATGSTQRFRNGSFQMATARGLQKKATVAQAKPYLIGKTYNRVTYIGCGSILRREVMLWNKAKPKAGAMFAEATETTGYSQLIDLTPNMNPTDIAKTVLDKFRAKHGSRFLIKPFLWAKLGQGTTRFHPETLGRAYEFTLKDLQKMYHNSSSMYIIEEGWEFPANDSPGWRYQITAAHKQEGDMWEEDLDSDDSDHRNALRPCSGCRRKYPSTQLPVHQRNCVPFREQEEGEEDNKAKTSRKKSNLALNGKVKAEPGLKLEPTSPSYTRPRPRPKQKWKGKGKQRATSVSSSGISIVNVIDSDDEQSAPALGKLLSKVAQHPAFGARWLSNQKQRLRSHLDLANSLGGVDSSNPTSTGRAESSYDQTESGSGAGPFDGTESFSFERSAGDQQLLESMGLPQVDEHSQTSDHFLDELDPNFPFQYLDMDAQGAVKATQDGNQRTSMEPGNVSHEIGPANVDNTACPAEETVSSTASKELDPSTSTAAAATSTLQQRSGGGRKRKHEAMNSADLPESSAAARTRAAKALEQQQAVGKGQRRKRLPAKLQ